MAKAKHAATGTIRNRRAHFDYELGDSLVAGVELSGREAKALRLGHGQLQGSYVTVKDDQLWLVNASVVGTAGIPIADTERTRTRRLLAKRREIGALIEAKQQGKTIVPLEILTRGRFIKLRIAIGKGKRKYDKRESIKKRDEARNMQAALKYR